MAGSTPAGTGRGPESWGEPSWQDHTDELTLVDEDRLPWLDSSGDVTHTAKKNWGRLAGLTLGGLALLGGIGGGLWWLANRDNGLAPEGSVIAAPSEPYRAKPTDPGGKQLAGTGDTSFAVGEGQRRESRLAEEQVSVPAASTPAASPTPGSQEQPAAAPVEPEEPQSPAVSGVGIQVGAYYNTAAAERGWSTLVRQTEALQGVPHRVVRGVADIGTVYRLQAVAPDAASAQRLCDALRADGLTCQVKR